MTTHAIRTRREGAGTANPGTAARGTADVLCLAAAPTFAVMALLAGLHGGGPPDGFCAAGQGGSLSDGMIWGMIRGMAWMYLLMSAFHAPPWLRLARGRRLPPHL